MSENDMSLRCVRNYNDVAAFRPFDRYDRVTPDVSWLPLNFDAALNQGTYFLRVPPNGQPFPHDHKGHEEFLVLQGELVDESGTRYREGDFVVFEPNARHESTSPAGAVLVVFIRGSTRGLVTPELLSLARPLIRNVHDAKHYVPFSVYGIRSPNVTWLPLTMDCNTGLGSYFATYNQTARSFPHEHPSIEQFLIVEGTFVDYDGTVFNKGDFVTYAPGSRHFSYSPDYAILAVFMSAENRRLSEEESRPLEERFRESTGAGLKTV